MHDIAARCPGLALAAFDDCILSTDEITDPWHYDRQVYIRLATRVERLLDDRALAAMQLGDSMG